MSEAVQVRDVPALPSNWQYCLDPKHPGANEVIHVARFFQFDGEGCPVCPACGKQVSAIPAVKDGVYPSGLLAVAARLA
jgi:hypothetical protein